MLHWFFSHFRLYFKHTCWTYLSTCFPYQLKWHTVQNQYNLNVTPQIIEMFYRFSAKYTQIPTVTRNYSWSCYTYLLSLFCLFFCQKMFINWLQFQSIYTKINHSNEIYPNPTGILNAYNYIPLNDRYIQRIATIYKQCKFFLFWFTI